MTVTTVSGLFLLGCPPAILWAVCPVIVNAVERVDRAPGGESTPGDVAHVGVEVLKRVTPPIAYGDPPAAIPRVRGIRRLIATLNHSSPHVEFTRVGHAVCSTQHIEMGHPFFVGAPTRLDTSGSGAQIPGWHDAFPATVTPTAPCRLLCLGGASVFNDDQFPEPLTDEIGPVVSAAAASFHTEMIADSDVQVTGFYDTGAPGANDCVVMIGFV